MPKIQVSRIYNKIQDALDKGFRVVSEQGSARSAKTVSSVIWLITRCLQYAGTTVAIVRGTRPALAGTVYRDFEWAMQEMGVWDRDCMNKSEFIYRFPNGSWIEFFPATDDQRLRGRKRQILYVNEANEISYEEWTQLILRTTVFAIIDYNPSFGDEHWIVQKINESPRTCFFISTYKDNPFLEQTVIDEIESLRETSPNLWRVYGLGLRAVIEGRIYKEFAIVDELPYEARKNAFIGMDFGYQNSYTAMVYVSIVGKKIYLRELCYRTQMSTTDIINRCKEINKEYKTNFKYWADSAEPREINEMYNAGINVHPVRKYAGSVIAGITKIQEYKLIITADSPNMKKEFENYIYAKDKNGNWLNEPVKAFDHCMDSMRYVVISEVLGNNSKGLDAQEVADILF